MNTFKWNPIKCGIFAAAALSPVANAADINFNGFASIRATAADADGSANSPFTNLKGDGDISFKDDSLFAVQASSDLGEGLSATVQLLARGQDDFDVEAEWAYISYELNDAHKLSVGRFANPIFYQSQYENVGYAHNYATLPRAVYIGFDFSTVEGVALDSTYFIGDYTLSTKLLYGSWSGESFFTSTNQDESWGLKDIMSVNATLSGDWWNLFAGGFTTELEGGSLDGAVFGLLGLDAAQAAGAVSAEEVEQFRQTMSWEGRDGIYWFAGFNAEYNNVIFDFEYADYVVDDSWDTPNQTFYVALGYRMDNVVVTAHYEDYEQDVDLGFLSGTTNPTLNAIGQGFHNANALDFDAWGIDVRYDFHPSAAFKFGYTSGEREQATIGDYDIISVGVDVVF